MIILRIRRIISFLNWIMQRGRILKMTDFAECIIYEIYGLI